MVAGSPEDDAAETTLRTISERELALLRRKAAAWDRRVELEQWYRMRDSQPSSLQDAVRACDDAARAAIDAEVARDRWSSAVLYDEDPPMTTPKGGSDDGS